jgi:hypothetical protein
MKNKLAILSLVALLAAGCSKSEPKTDVGRFQMIFKPAGSKAPELIYLLDSSTGRIWTFGIARETSHPDGTSDIEYSGWREEFSGGLAKQEAHRTLPARVNPFDVAETNLGVRPYKNP